MLVHRAVAGVGIVGHAVLIEPRVNGFVAAQQRILALPRPDGGGHLAHAIARLPINTVVHLAGDGVCRVVLDQRAQGVHDRQAVAARRFHVVITENDILVTVLQKGLFCQLGTPELRMGVGIPHCNSPAADAGHIAALDQHIGKACRAGSGLICGLQGGHVNAAVVHVLVVHVAVYIMDQQVLQCDAAARAPVLRNHSHAGALQLIRLGILLADDSVGAVRQFQITHRDIGCIIQQHGGGYIPAVHMGGGVQCAAIVLIPKPLPVGVNARRGPLAIGGNRDGAVFFAAAAQVQELLFKHAAAFQQHRVTGGQGQPVDGKQCGQRFFRRQAVVGVTACLRVHVIGLAQGCRTPPPASAFR